MSIKPLLNSNSINNKTLNLFSNTISVNNVDTTTINGAPVGGGGVQNPLTSDLKLDGFRILEELASLSPSLNIEQEDPSKEIKLGVGLEALRIKQSIYGGLKINELDPIKQIQIGTDDGIGNDSNIRTLGNATQFDKNIEMNANINDNGGGSNIIGDGGLFWGDVRSTKLTGDGIYEKSTGSQNLVLNTGDTQSLKNIDMNSNDINNCNNINLIDNAIIENNNNGYSLRNSRDAPTDNIFIAPSENIFYKNINLQSGVNIGLPFNNVNTIGGPTTRMADIWTNKLNGIVPIGSLSTGISNSLLLTTSTTEQSILPVSFLGSRSVPPNTFQQGDAYYTTCSGSFSSNNGDTLTIRLKSNGITLNTFNIPLNASAGVFFELAVNFSIRQIGVAGVAQLVSSFQFTYNQSAGGNFQGIRNVSINSTTFDTTILNNLDITGQFSSASASNSIQTIASVLYKTY